MRDCVLVRLYVRVCLFVYVFVLLVGWLFMYWRVCVLVCSVGLLFVCEFPCVCDCVVV